MVRIGLWLVAGLAISVMLVSPGVAQTVAAKQRLAIEERAPVGASRGTFKLRPLTPGPVKADAGTFTFSVKPRPSVVVAGQRLTTYTWTSVLTGKRGTLRIRAVTKSADGGGGYLVGTGPWTVSGGTRAYAKLRGGGTGAGVVTPAKVIFTRYEGFLRRP